MILSSLLILGGVLLNATAQLLLKAGTNSIGQIGPDHGPLVNQAVHIATQPHILAGLTCYVLSVGLWIVALSRVPVSVAYPMLSIGYIVNAVAAWYLFGESLTPMKVGGMLVILVGVWMVARSA